MALSTIFLEGEISSRFNRRHKARLTPALEVLKRRYPQEFPEP